LHALRSVAATGPVERVALAGERPTIADEP
jgi:hypothetical protein